MAGCGQVVYKKAQDRYARYQVSPCGCIVHRECVVSYACCSSCGAKRDSGGIEWGTDNRTLKRKGGEDNLRAYWKYDEK